MKGNDDRLNRGFLRNWAGGALISILGLMALACGNSQLPATPWPVTPPTADAQLEKDLAALPAPKDTNTTGAENTAMPEYPPTAAAPKEQDPDSSPSPTHTRTQDSEATATVKKRATVTRQTTPTVSNTPDLGETGTSDVPVTEAAQEDREPATPAAPTATNVPDRPDLYLLADTPEHMAYVYWSWEGAADGERKEVTGFQELVTEFTIHNDVMLLGDHGLYLMLAYGSINGQDYYFGLQTDVHSPEPPFRRGKGLLFSRWGTRDLANARYSQEEGWRESSGHEGDFIGVRRSYGWGAGDYRVTLAPDGEPNEDGAWMGLWITDLETGDTTWAGSLKFPAADGSAIISPASYSTVEIYGSRIRPVEIPQWHVSIKRPEGDGVKATGGMTGYSPFYGQITNNEANYNQETQEIHLKVGGDTSRKTEQEKIPFEDTAEGAG